ncbi:MAG: DUF177 domain-containing protein [Deltaproteobacteria bacterium]|nr:DUF177 domain-containing protein [Deltaproteobacteria bacterium]
MNTKHGHKSNRAVSPDLKIRVDRIGDDGINLDEELSASWIKQALGKDSPFRVERNGHLVLRLDKVDEVVRARGRLSVSLLSQCVRCLSPVDLGITTEIDVTLFPPGSEPASGSEGELTEDDIGVSLYEDGIIDLGNIVHDEVFLELPMNPVCSENCAGLCTSCGVNLNDKKCNCVSSIDPRWQGLQNIKVN